jgi:hypothetical protein
MDFAGISGKSDPGGVGLRMWLIGAAFAPGTIGLFVG